MTDDVYRERARLVALVAALYPSVRAYSDPAEPEWSVVYVDSPAGQLSWHIAEGDVDLFAHVPLVDAGDPGAVWDGHTTEEKYHRVAELITKRAPGYVVNVQVQSTGPPGICESELARMIQHAITQRPPGAWPS